MFKCFVLVFLAGVSGEFQCPEAGTGFFPDPDECDLYYECSKGQYEEKLCPDGLVFDDKDPNHERCEVPANVNCGDRTALQEPKPSKGCPRANGYYPHPDASVCDKFYNCVDGIPKEISCPPGLIYNEKSSTCTWPSDAQRKECFKVKKDVLDDGFQCPEGDTALPDGRKLPHPTFPHPEDCAKFYICRNGVAPTLGSCSGGTVYNVETFHCDDPENVPGCEDYYKSKGETTKKE